MMPKRIWADPGELFGAVRHGSWADTIRQVENGTEYILAADYDALRAKAQAVVDAWDIPLSTFEPIGPHIEALRKALGGEEWSAIA